MLRTASAHDLAAHVTVSSQGRLPTETLLGTEHCPCSSTSTEFAAAQLIVLTAAGYAACALVRLDRVH